MKGKTLFWAGIGTFIAVASLKLTFELGAKMGMAYTISAAAGFEIPTEVLSEILPEDKGKWNKDISKLIQILQRKEKRNA